LLCVHFTFEFYFFGLSNFRDFLFVVSVKQCYILSFCLFCYYFLNLYCLSFLLSSLLYFFTFSIFLIYLVYLL
jgi:hypothetical protein